MGGGAASSTASRLASTSPGRGRTPAVVCNGLVQMTPPPLHSTIDDTLDYCGPASPWRGGRGRALAVTGTRACPPLPLHTQMKLRGGQSVGSGHAHPRPHACPPPLRCVAYSAAAVAAKPAKAAKAQSAGRRIQDAVGSKQPALHRGGPPILEMATTTTTAF